MQTTLRNRKKPRPAAPYLGKPKQAKHKPPSKRWQKLLRLIPGYDSFAQAAGCWFDPVAAQAAIDFFPECLHHVEGALAGEPFVLEPWEKSIIANLCGWFRIDESGRVVRRFREALIYVPRKNGKSPLIAGLACYIFFCDKEAGQQNYIAAGEREQAGMLFRHVKGMVKAEPELDNRCRIYGGNAAAGQSKSLVREEDGSFLRVIAASGETQHGGNTHMAMIDELHVQPNRELFDVFTTSMASKNRKNPLFICITTADFDRESICNEMHDRACKVRDNKGDRSQPGFDPAFLPVIYETLVDEDWTDEKVWEKSNPNLDVSVSRDYLRRECQKAKENPAYENTFRRLHLNQKTSQDARVIPMDKWDVCGKDANPVEWRTRMLESLKGQQCAGGLDLGSVSDLTSLALLFGNDEEGYDLLPFFWGPEVNAAAREKKDGVPYLTWERQGFMTLTDGNETDYQFVRAEINRLANDYGIHTIAGDRLFQGAQLLQDLTRDGLNVLAFGQGYISMAAPTRRFLELVSAGKLRHGNNPILRWMAGNAAAESEHAGSDAPLKFSKKKSKEKIDGIIGATMAVGVAMTGAGESSKSVYERENRGFVQIG